MSDFAPVAARFISAVRRRIAIVRIAEQIAVSIALSSAAGFLLLPILWWRGQPTLMPAIGLLLLGCVLGLIWGTSRRPSLLQAAIEADRQLSLDDLLGTILLLQNSRSESDWHKSLAAFADQRCASLHPAAIIVNRIGIRGWAGVGILGSILLTLSLFTSQPTEATAASSALAAQPDPPASIALNYSENPTTPTGRPPGPGGADDLSTRGFPNNQIADGNTPLSPEKSQSRSPSGSNSAQGNGTATSSIPIPNEPMPWPTAGGGAPKGSIADGDGQSDSNIKNKGENNSHTVTPSPGKPAKRWTTPTQPPESTGPDQTNANPIPQEDADLVRDYFSRD